MPSSQWPAVLVALMDWALGGLISNAFIVTVTLREWAVSKSLTSNEQLLLSLGISNLCATVALAPVALNSFSTTIVSNNLVAKLFPFVIFIVTSRFWFTAWLCVFYCVKIVNSTQPLFLWWKLRISWLIPRLLLASLVIPFIIGCHAFRNILVSLKSSKIVNVTNESQRHTEPYLPASFKLLFLIIGSALPFLLVLLCSILVVGSLCRHVCRIKGKKCGFRSCQTEAHKKAAGTVLCLLVLYISFVVIQGYATGSFSLERNVQVFLSVVMMAYSPAQATVLVLVNPKLKQAATQMLGRPEL